MRALRISLIVLVIFGGLFVAADRIAVELAEDQVAGKIRSSRNLSSEPSVSINGFPFLTQVMDKKFGDIDAELTGISTESAGTSITVDRVTVELNDVRLTSGFSAAVADRASGVALITYDALTKAAPQGVQVGYGGAGEDGTATVKVTAKLLDEPSVYSTVTIVNGDTVRVRANEIPASEIPGWEGLIRKEIDFERRITGLPAGLKLEKVEVTKEGIKVTVKGTNVELTG